MPALGKMSDEKSNEYPVVVAEVASSPAKPRNTKKYVIIAISGVLAAAIILTAILVGMYMFTEAQKEIIKYAMNLGNNDKQVVTSDPNENVVQYHVSNPSQETWIVNDFNKDIQLTKIVAEGKTNCYLSALNRTNAMDPSKINGPETTDLKDAVSLVYRVSDTPITDSSFLSKTAKDLCKGVSVYWLYPYCSSGPINKNTNNTNVDHPKTKRQTTINNSPYYYKNDILYYSPYTGSYYWVPCFTGCCRKICACQVTYSYYVANGLIYCSFTIYSCPPHIYNNPLYYDGTCIGPNGLGCNANHYCN